MLSVRVYFILLRRWKLCLEMMRFYTIDQCLIFWDSMTIMKNAIKVTRYGVVTCPSLSVVGYCWERASMNSRATLRKAGQNIMPSQLVVNPPSTAEIDPVIQRA
jgi:hypothetical protein